MNPELMAAVIGGAVVAAAAAAVWALRPRSAHPAEPRPQLPVMGHFSRLSPRTRTVLLVSVAAGVLVALITGWVVGIVLLPAAALGLPYLLAAPPAARTIRRLEAMEEWTRSLAGVLGAGVGLEQAITATLRSTPDVIKPEVVALAARLRARWDTTAALRAFADDLNDVTGDLVAANLVLAAKHRNRSLGQVLEGVAASVAEDVATRRRVEAGRDKPRGSARTVTIFSFVVLAWMALTGDYVAPYSTPLGQVVLVVLLACYAGALLWLRKMAEGKSLPRFLGPEARAGAR